MTPRIGLILLTALLEIPWKRPFRVRKPFPPGSRKQPTSTEETPCSTPPG